MTNKMIKSRQDFLLNLLDLPNIKSSISSLSGGQLRRVSFAVSLLNEPKILMLDEPTVGMDPILRKKIWDHLELISIQNQTTIIITTHCNDILILKI
jgi:ABC-type multidrug transport system ATPase subunit